MLKILVCKVPYDNKAFGAPGDNYWRPKALR